MHLAFICLPAAGHVNPTLPVVAELVRRGHRVTYGRPHVGAEKGGKSPVIRGAIPRSEFELLQGLRAKTGRSQSELVREAVHLLLERHKLTG